MSKKQDRCNLCGKSIMWLKSAASGSRIPLDMEPDENGDIIIFEQECHVLRGELFEEMHSGPRYIQHNCRGK